MISALLPSFLEAAKRRGNLHSVVAVLIKKMMLEAKGGEVNPVNSLSHSAQSDEPELLLGRSYPSYATI